MVLQVDLFGRGPPSLGDLRGTEVTDLGAGAWMLYVPGWLQGHQEVFTAVHRTTHWQAQRRQMYERVVDVPRLLGCFPEDGPGHPILWEAADRLSERFDWNLRALAAAYYRDGNDSVAPHGDKLGKLARNTVVAVLSLGERRKFTLRQVKGPGALDLNTGWGDLVVMGGTCQVTWLHGVPKARFAGPRISIQFRPCGAPRPERKIAEKRANHI